MPKLTDQTLKKKTKIGEYTDAQTPGLTLVVRASTSASRPNALRRIWTFRFTLDGKRRKLGLGSYPSVTLEEARQKARDAAAMVAKDLDPRLARRANPENLTFRAAAEAYLDDTLPRFTSEKSRRNLQHALRVHCAPLHARPVLQIGTRDVANLLKAIAILAPQRAEKVRAALRGLFAHVGVGMEDQGVIARNPVLSVSLKAANYIPAPSKGHHPALDPSEAPEFMQALRAIPTMDARLLEFAILTVSRAGAARAARFDQIDVVNSTWIVPPEQLKDGRTRKGEPFLVPLSPRALAVVEEMRALRPAAALIFEGAGDMTLVNLMRRMCRARPWLDPKSKKPIVAHGFRACFRTFYQGPKWSRELVELSMGHKFYGEAEDPYQRGDLLDERRTLLNDWTRYLEGPPAGAKVIPMRRA